MFSTRFQWLQFGLSDRYEQISNWTSTHIAPKINSKPMLMLRGTVHGAVKSAYASHLLFDLGLSLIPLTSPWYNGLTLTKYTITGLAFVVSSGTGYYHRKREASKNDLVTELEQQLKLIDDALEEAEQMLEEQEKLLKEFGFNFHEQKPEIPGLPIEEPQPEAKTECKQCEESIVGRSLKAIFNGAVNGTGIKYIFNAAEKVALSSPSSAYSVIGTIASWSAFIGTTARSYAAGPAEIALEERIKRIGARLSVANQKVKVFQRLLGSRAALIKIAEYGSKVTQNPIWFETEEAHQQTSNPSERNCYQFFKCTQSDGFKKFRSGTDGAYIAGSVQNMCEILLPQLVVLHYLASVLALGLGSKKSFRDRKKRDFFEEQMQDLKVKILDITGILEVARVVMGQMRAYVSTLLKAAGKEYKPSEIVQPAPSSDSSVYAESTYQSDNKELNYENEYWSR